ncbi:hypothetical protein PanWU01x14_360300 [Parasponia andersonii]|uniref:Uncharacterized protein n=1 Tax=Parasponia andersonii TaxID=3476 RepID=A0A2P5A7P5_PARAD|nr:hypothetical protein PanWU01x14_360300 [Parasponia andersonii]
MGYGGKSNLRGTHRRVSEFLSGSETDSVYVLLGEVWFTRQDSRVVLYWCCP